MSSKPKQTKAQKELERSSIEREKQLRVENARQTTKAFSDNIAFRKKLRGIFSLLSGGFAGFPLGSSGGLGVSAGSGSGGGRSGGGGGVGGIAGGGSGSGVGGPRRGSSSGSGSGGGSGGGARVPRGPGPGRHYR